MIQLTFDLPRRTGLARSDFFVSDGNAMAAEWIDRWPDWPSGALVLHGPPGCGKTHLAHLWCARASAIIVSGERLDEEALPCLLARSRHRIAIDDADRAPERALLHLHNSCLECRGSLLITTRRPPGSWNVVLDDLRSRVRAALAVEIGLPDDALLGAVLFKHFADRQKWVAPEVVAYLIRRIERSFVAAAELADRLDTVALRNKCAITIQLARDLLEETQDQDLPPERESGVT